MSSEPSNSLPKGDDRPEVAIRARGLTKAYHVYARPQDRLRQLLWPGRRRFFREFRALQDVDLEIYRGETVGLVGRNGSGKSTLLKLISGTLEPSAGELEVHGHLAPLLTLGTGFNPEFTGRENVFTNAALLGLQDSEIHERLDAIVAFADIGEFFDQPVKAYSTGMHARLAFAVAINVDPEILVIDEILAVGDEAFTRKCFAKIEEIKRRGSTILFASHAAGSVVALCDRAVLLENGERLLTANPKTVIACYQKLIHAPPDLVATLAEEIREQDRSPNTLDPTRDDPGERVEVAPGTLTDGAGHLDPNLAPKSTLCFAERGARISGVRILDPEERPVNMLRTGEIYTFAYEVEFSQSAEGVRFGMMLKLVTGLELGGQVSHLPGAGIGRVEAGETASVRFRFRASLTRGAYFLNAGVLGLVGVEERYLHRILDASMFRVEADAGRVTGRVDLANGPASVEIAPSSTHSTHRSDASRDGLGA